MNLVSVEVVPAPLRAPFRAGWGEVTSRELVVVAVSDDEGRVGYGEAAPLAGYDGVSVPEVVEAISALAPVLDAAGSPPLPKVMARCAEATVVPQALAAVDMALWDLAGRVAGRPVWELLGGNPAPVAVNYTISASDRAGAAAEAGAARADGFECLKLKVAIGDDAGRVAAVRAVAGPAMALRLDANGAWLVEEALAALPVLAPAGIELCEEPVHGLDPISRLSMVSPVPLALDESASLPGALSRRVCEAVCLKVGASGGISGLLDAAARARRAGYDVYLASTLDGPLGIAAAVHAACVLRPARACGLATLRMFSPHPGRRDPLPVSSGRIEVPPGPGLGEGLIDWYRR